jgi:hypothetical protein
MDDRTDAERFMVARTGIVDAAQQALAQFDHTTDAMITGYVMAVEYLGSDGDYQVWWLCGTGQPSEESLAGLPSWRVEGLARKVVNDIASRNVRDE